MKIAAGFSSFCLAPSIYSDREHMAPIASVLAGLAMWLPQRALCHMPGEAPLLIIQSVGFIPWVDDLVFE